MLSTAVGGRRRAATSFSSPVDATASPSPPNTATGKVTSRAAIAPNRPVAKGPVVGRRHEHHPPDEGQGREERRLPQEIAGLGTELDRIERLAADAVPESRPTIDCGELGQEPPLAVPDHHHAAQRRILTLGIELLHRSRQRGPQPSGRVADRVTGVVQKIQIWNRSRIRGSPWSR